MKKTIAIAISVIVIAVGAYFISRKKEAPPMEVKVSTGSFKVTIPASGTIQPENKITITSPIAGRVDKILVDEGSSVRKGQTIAWMSSTDRAALMDSARAQGEQALKEWGDVYRPTPIVAPAAGVIISKDIVVGQTVTQSTTLFNLSDRLIVMANVDETDLGKIKEGQEASVKVDSFPNLEVVTKVARIAHQSVVKNSINSYEVLLRSDKLPDELRAGMTANIHFLYQFKESTVLLPTWIAEGKENFATTLQVKTDNGSKPQEVKFGLSNGESIEVLSGLQGNETLLVKQTSITSEAKKNVLFGGGSSKKK